ncbi:hypothetical protein XELAEV_18018970mg [Xenopus laevis]|uniref:Uncharacterized protein n=1 Tax=Xenopus laevis TaxID=8355 RepID=A0A974DER4_XENLA|nr:hypothetical protein XELAEV_18018970mg [Xenopus laevis]
MQSSNTESPAFISGQGADCNGKFLFYFTLIYLSFLHHILYKIGTFGSSLLIEGNFIITTSTSKSITL